MSIDELIRDRLETLVEPVEHPDAVLAEIRARRTAPTGRRTWWLAAAAVATVALGFGVVATATDDAREVTAGPDTTAVPTEEPIVPGEVTFRVWYSGEAQVPMGTLRAATTEAELDELLNEVAFRPPRDPSEYVDLDDQVVVAITIPDDACPPMLDRFDVEGDVIEPVFVETRTECTKPLIPKTFVVALDWASTGPEFRLRLPANPLYELDETTIDVVRPAGGAGVDLPPVEPLRADVEVPSAVRSGDPLAATVVVQNDTGAPIVVGGCIEPFDIALHLPGTEPSFFSLTCAQSFTLPPGASRWPLSISAAPQFCLGPGGASADPTTPPCQPDGAPPGLSPGRYLVSVQSPEGAPPVDPVEIEVVA